MLLVRAWDNLGWASPGWGSHVMLLWNQFETRRGVYDFKSIDTALAKSNRPCYLQLGFSMYDKGLAVPIDYTPQFHSSSIALKPASGYTGYVPDYSPTWTAAYNNAVSALTSHYRDNQQVVGYWASAGWGQETQAAVNNGGGQWADILKPLLKEETYLDFIRSSTTYALQVWAPKPVYLPGAPSPGNVWGHKKRDVIAALLDYGAGYMNCGLQTDNDNSMGLGVYTGLGMYDIVNDGPVGFEEGRRFNRDEPLEVYWLLLRARHWHADFVNLYNSISGPHAEKVIGLLPKEGSRWIVFRDAEFPPTQYMNNGMLYGHSGEPGTWGNGLEWVSGGELVFDPKRYDYGRWALKTAVLVQLRAPGLEDGLYKMTMYYSDGTEQVIEQRVLGQEFTLEPNELYHRVDVGERIQETKMGAIVGPHVINGFNKHLDALRRWQPRLALVLDPNDDDVRTFRQICPNTIVVGRIYAPDSEVESKIRYDPKSAAAWAHQLALSNSAVADKLIDYVQIANEVLQFYDGLPLLTEFELERMRLADRYGSYACALYGFSVGQPDLPAHDRLALWRLTYPALDYAEDHGHIVAVHEYGAPNLWGPAEKGGADWLIHRLEHQVLPILPYDNLMFAVTEYGIDGLLLNGLSQARDVVDLPEYGVGVRTDPKNIMTTETRGLQADPRGWSSFTTAQDYVTQLTNIGQYCEQYSDRVLGYAVFTDGHNPPWQSYDITGEVENRLADYYESSSVIPPPPDPEPEEPVMTKIYDQKGVEHDAEWLKKTFGVIVVPASVSVGKKFTLSLVKVTEGPATLMVRVNDATGQPLASHAVAFSWPDAPTDLTTPEAEVFKTRYKPKANVQWTDTNGVTGYGLGMGSYIYDVDEGGPHAAWVLHDQYESDVLDRFGMLAGTNHIGPLDLTFVLSDMTAVPTTLDEALKAEAEAHDVLAVNPQAALCKAGNAKKLWPTSDEFPVSFGGVGYVAQRFRDPTNDAIHVLYCVVGQWDKIVDLTY